MNAILIFQLSFLLALANGAPVVAKKLLGGRFARPVDGGALLGDGRPLFGPSKTWRGLVSSVLATWAGALLVGLPAPVGIIVGAGAMAGDLISSFSKRRLGLPPSSQALGLDQIPEALLPLLSIRPLMAASAAEIVVVVAGFSLGSLVLSRILFGLRIRDQPF